MLISVCRKLLFVQFWKTKLINIKSAALHVINRHPQKLIMRISHRSKIKSSHLSSRLLLYFVSGLSLCCIDFVLMKASSHNRIMTAVWNAHLVHQCPNTWARCSHQWPKQIWITPITVTTGYHPQQPRAPLFSVYLWTLKPHFTFQDISLTLSVDTPGNKNWAVGN